jgi:hypothetical protein
MQTFDSLLERWRTRERTDGPGAGSAGSPGGTFLAAAAAAARRGFSGGAASPAAPRDLNEAYVPWSTVEAMISMARDALSAKQKVSEVLRAEAQRLHAERDSESEEWSKVGARGGIGTGAGFFCAEAWLSWYPRARLCRAAPASSPRAHRIRPATRHRSSSRARRPTATRCWSSWRA